MHDMLLRAFEMRVNGILEPIPPENLEGEDELRNHDSRPRETPKNPSTNPYHLHQNEFIKRIEETCLDNNQLEDTAQIHSQRKHQLGEFPWLTLTSLIAMLMSKR